MLLLLMMLSEMLLGVDIVSVVHIRIIFVVVVDIVSTVHIGGVFVDVAICVVASDVVDAAV